MIPTSHPAITSVERSKTETTPEIEISPKPFDAERSKALVERVMQTHIARTLARANLSAARDECERAEHAYACARSDVDREVARVCGIDRFKL